MTHPTRRRWIQGAATTLGAAAVAPSLFAQSGPVKIGSHASTAILEELAKDPTLGSFDPNLADVLVVPANGVPPGNGNGGEAEDDPDHLGG